MKHSSIVVAISLATAAPVFADDPKSPAFTPREMAHCMMKRLRANAGMSYRDAFKACKEQFDVARSDHAGDPAIAAATLPENPKQ